MQLLGDIDTAQINHDGVGVRVRLDTESITVHVLKHGSNRTVAEANVDKPGSGDAHGVGNLIEFNCLDDGLSKFAGVLADAFADCHGAVRLKVTVFGVCGSADDGVGAGVVRAEHGNHGGHNSLSNDGRYFVGHRERYDNDMAEPIRILFLCTGNSARSIMAESIANHLYASRIEAISAGSDPKASPHPLALETLRRHGLPTDSLSSKSVDEIVDHDVDLVVTLCDSAASEPCPSPLAGVSREHWGFPDPPTQPDPEAAFEAVYKGLVAAMEQFLT